MTAGENVETIRRGFAAFSRGDFEAGVADMRPDVVWHMAFRLPDLPPDKRIYRGHDEVRKLWAAFASAWSELRLSLEEVVLASEDVVVVRVRFVGHGGASGIEVDRTLFYVMELDEGKLRRCRPFDTESEALAAVPARQSGSSPASDSTAQSAPASRSSSTP